MSITFVTSLLHILPEEKIDTLLINICSLLANTNIQLCIYISPEYTKITETLELFPNVKIMRTISLENTRIASVISGIFKCGSDNTEIKLPEIRNETKDTMNFLMSGHTKHEFLKEVVCENPFGTGYFAWIDFNIIGLFKHRSEMFSYLKWLSNVRFSKSMLLMPGCWDKIKYEKMDDLANTVNWRFCGGFLLGDDMSILSFVELYETAIVQFLEKYRILTWDFNLWAWMEIVYEDKWKPDWYKADHSDNIFSFSGDYMVHNLTLSGLDGGEGYIHKKTYDYIEIPTYYPTSGAYLFYRGKHILNTRYVNYWIYPSGCYHFNSGKRLIENKNVYSELSENDLVPMGYDIMTENVGLPSNRDCLSVGLEDIRLYEFDGEMKYIATTMGYVPEGRSRMIYGKYNVETRTIEEGTIIRPPSDTWCEKNWIPIVHKGEELFIYKWFPLEIGKVVDVDGAKKLDIQMVKRVEFPLFRKIRGSSIFVETEEGYMGVVHYSEEHSPRHYYHMLVVLDKETLEIAKCSELFVFEKLGIEFCIGFMIRNKMEYVFWISRHDRDPVMISVGMGEIKWIWE